jgi:putative two-component system response regulator
MYAEFQDAGLKQSRLVIVDDQPANVKLLARLLENNGYTNVLGITDSREVLKLIDNEKLDLLLLDIRMPHVDGYQVLDTVRSHPDCFDLPVIVLTAQTDTETRHQALDAGANDFLTKPYDHAEVLLRVRNTLEMRMLYNELTDFNDRLAERVRERTRELDQTIVEIVRRLGRAAEFRDNETGMHVVRMSRFASIIARHMGFDEDQADLLEKAAPMHDLGKIGISDAVLLKPDALTDDEFTRMKTHPEIGAQILSNSPYPLLQLAEKIAHMHHEKWDGSGYPAGLKGDQIPLEVCIVAVADVFDALTSVRPYKEAWPVEKALGLIRKQSGHHFNPEVVDAFLTCLPKILEVRERYAD